MASGIIPGLEIGYGTFTIIVGFILALLITFFVGRSSRAPEVICLLSMIIPVILIIIFTTVPKQSQLKGQDTTQSDPWFPLHVFAIVFGIVCALGASLCLLGHYAFTGLRAIRISSQLEMERDKQRGERRKLPK